MSANIGKNGVVTASLIDGKDKVSIMEEDITIGKNLIIGGSGKKKEGFFENADIADDGELEFRFVTNEGTGERWSSHQLHYGFEININDYTPGETLTWSYDIMLIRKDETFTINEHWMGQRYTAPTWKSVTLHGISLPTTLNVWEHREIERTIPTSNYPQPGALYQTLITFSNTAPTAGTIIIRLRNVKLEKGSKATSWCPNKMDGLGEQTDIVYKNPIMANDFIEI